MEQFMEHGRFFGFSPSRKQNWSKIVVSLLDLKKHASWFRKRASWYMTWNTWELKSNSTIWHSKSKLVLILSIFIVNWWIWMIKLHLWYFVTFGVAYQGLTFLQKWSGFSPYHLGDSYRFVRVGLKRSPLELSEDLQGAFLYLLGVRGSVAPKTWVILLPFTFKGVCKLFRRASPLLLYSLGNFYSFHCSAFSMQIVLFIELYNLGYYEKGGHRGRGTGSEHGSWKKEKNGTTQGMVIEFRFCSHFSFSRFPFLVISNI